MTSCNRNALAPSIHLEPNDDNRRKEIAEGEKTTSAWKKQEERDALV